jgi:hypothetical protein
LIFKLRSCENVELGQENERTVAAIASHNKRLVGYWQRGKSPSVDHYCIEVMVRGGYLATGCLALNCLADTSKPNRIRL